ncbi:tetratricopeptide repeat protein [Candidatus Margulisiibacteriota bacterium]
MELTQASKIDILKDKIKDNSITIDEGIELFLLQYASNYQEDAEKTLNILIEKFPKDYRSYLEYGKIYISQNDEKKALQYLLEATDRDFNQEEPHMLIAKIYQKQKKYDEALAEIKCIFFKHPKNKTAHKVMAEVLLDKGDIKNAEKEIKKLGNEYKYDYEIKNIIAKIFKAKGDHKKAYEWFQKSAEQFSEQPDILFELGSLQAKEKNYKESVEWLTKCARLKPEYPEIDTLFNTTLQKYINELDKKIKKEPDNIPALLEKMQIDITLRHFDKALELCNSILKHDPENTAAQINLGYIYYEQDKPFEAKKYFEKAKPFMPHNKELDKNIIKTNKKSLEFIAEQLTTVPNWKEGKILQAQINFSLGNIKTAAEQSFKISLLHPQEYQSFISPLANENIKLLISIISKSLQWEQVYALCVLFLGEQKLTEAKKSFLQSYTLNKKDSNLLTIGAFIHYILKEYKQAFLLIDSAINPSIFPKQDLKEKILNDWLIATETAYTKSPHDLIHLFAYSDALVSSEKYIEAIHILKEKFLEVEETKETQITKKLNTYYQKILATLQQKLRYQKENEKIYVEMITILHEAHQSSLVLHTITEGIENSKNPQPIEDYLQNNIDTILQEMETKLIFHQDNPFFIEQLAIGFSFKKDQNKTIHYLKELLKRDPKHFKKTIEKKYFEFLQDNADFQKVTEFVTKIPRITPGPISKTI